MQVDVFRQWVTVNSVCGQLSLDGVFECFTLEPPYREPPAKPRCIPAGTYRAVKKMSPHFGERTIWLLNVPDFDDIEIHPGNWPRDTKGCTVVGSEHSEDFVGNSRNAFSQLMVKLPDEFEITYHDLPSEA